MERKTQNSFQHIDFEGEGQFTVKTYTMPSGMQSTFKHVFFCSSYYSSKYILKRLSSSWPVGGEILGLCHMARVIRWVSGKAGNIFHEPTQDLLALF